MNETALTYAARPEDFGVMLRTLANWHTLTHLAILLGCLAGAWLTVYLVRRATTADSPILLGDKPHSGVLFPVLALVFMLVTQRLVYGAVPPLVFRLALPILVSLLILRVAGRVLRAALPDSRAARNFERTLSWAAWIGVILWVTGVLPLVLEWMEQVTWRVGGAKLSLRNVLEAIVNAGIVMVLALWLSAVIEARLMANRSAHLSVRKMLSNATRMLLLFVGLLLALSAAGIDLTALSVFGGALGVGIGFGLQRLASNYVSGFVILAERSVRIGDLITVDTFEGRVTDINTRYTVIRAINGRESIVPNEMLVLQRVENASLADTAVLLSTAFRVVHGTDAAALRPKLVEVASTVPRVMRDEDRTPAVHLSGISPEGLEFTIWFWIADPLNGQGNVRSDLNIAVLELLAREGIEIAASQRIVRVAAIDAAGAEAGTPSPVAPGA
ncbi:mechanosensitive ion channel family protein [Rivibacter subsaxonicus]|uniref:Mechanosensitive ion channel-like protein n=1 Tax=Rivibacter subsaxonicus TaxID=457575 RepID=A0A4V2FTG1_9BURK|nr:mechanosensitive ion channel domain-containing protein [Rivibacter subsaxonicus]RZT98015.1 mechanosensitive ion channel-like protein [Rivibacter subsaxonicus]